ncbi:MAG: UDP-N-acetylmuramoyl-L-alanyl-D-glutamate--2,6-diaminopimelate ligase [Planctomycetota bacterium]
MLFSKLLSTAGLSPLRRRGDVEVTEVVTDSRRVRQDGCFVAVRGTQQDGHAHIGSAVKAGAAAVVCEDDAEVPASVACAVVDNTHIAAGRLAQAIRGWPVRKLDVVAVTGTNGKTTVTHLLRGILSAAGAKPALLGTISYQTGARSAAASVTTPSPIELAEMAEEMVANGRTHLVMEVSSHALDQDRTAGLEPKVAVFTNLSGDHLDYHRTMESYLAAKRRLFEQLPPHAFAVINRDDAWGEEFATATRADVWWYGLSPAADVRARIDEIEAAGSRFTLIARDARAEVSTPLIGRHNVYNAVAAATAAMALGVNIETIASALKEVDRVPGRLERVEVAAPYQVFVDYAHTDDALENVLGALRPVTRGRLIVVFGCGGDRDRSKRPRMARVAESLADYMVITSDNPRSEKPEAIIEEIVAGLSSEGKEQSAIEPDRGEAIRRAVESASAGDVVVIAGKGHEKTQIIGDERIEFDDVQEAARAVRRRESQS